MVCLCVGGDCAHCGDMYACLLVNLLYELQHALLTVPHAYSAPSGGSTTAAVRGSTTGAGVTKVGGTTTAVVAASTTGVGTTTGGRAAVGAGTAVGPTTAATAVTRWVVGRLRAARLWAA